MYSGGGECCGGSKAGLNVSVSATGGKGKSSAGITTGGLSRTWAFGRTLDTCGVTIFLQQSCALLAGLQGMCWQHFIDCWSWVIARHSAKGTASRRPSTTTKDVSLQSIQFDSRLY